MIDRMLISAAISPGSMGQRSTWWKDSLFAKLADKVRRVFSELFACFSSQPKWVMQPPIQSGMLFIEGVDPTYDETCCPFST